MATEAGRPFDGERFVEPVGFFFCGWIKPFHPTLIHINVARGASAATLSSKINAPIANDFHHAPSVERGKGVLAAVMIDHEKNRLVFW